MSDILTAPEAPAVERMLIAPRHLVPWPGLNPRRQIPEERIEQLAASIQKEGVLQNLVVHETGDSVRWIVAGVTRWRAAALLAARGVEILLPCSVREYSEDRALELAMLENVHRGDLTVIEEARGYRRLVEEFGHSQAELAEKFLGDASRQSQISNKIRLLELPEPVLDFVEDGVLPWSYARDLLLPWMKREDVRDRFFSALVEHLRLQADFGGPVGKPWLLETLAAIAAPLEKKPAPAPEPKPEPRWALGEDARAELRKRGKRGFQEEHGYAIYHPAIEAFNQGITLYIDGYPEPARAKSIDTPAETRARVQGWRWAEEQHAKEPATSSAGTEYRDTPLQSAPEVTGSEELLRESARGDSGGTGPAPDLPSAVPSPDASGDLGTRQRASGPQQGDSTAEAAARSAPAPQKPAAAKPAPAPAAPAPVAVLPPPGAARQEVPEGAGIVAALLAVTGGRPTTLSVTPLPDGRVAVTVAPRPAKAGETPFARTGPAEGLDQELLAALDAHFNR